MSYKVEQEILIHIPELSSDKDMSNSLVIKLLNVQSHLKQIFVFYSDDLCDVKDVDYNKCLHEKY